MATPQAIQIRALEARNAMEQNLARIAETLAITLPEPNREWSADPNYRAMVELENIAATVAVIAEAVAPVAEPEPEAEPNQVEGEPEPEPAAEAAPDFASMSVGDLRRLADDIGLEHKGMTKPQLIDALKGVAGE